MIFTGKSHKLLPLTVNRKQENYWQWYYHMRWEDCTAVQWNLI